MQKIHFFDFFILHRLYSKPVLIYSRFYTSLISNLVTYRSSLLKKRNIVTIRTCFYLNSLNQVYLNYTTFNIHLNYSKFNVYLNYSKFNVHLNYSKFNVYLNYSNLKLHLNYPAFKFHFNFRHSDFYLNYSTIAFDLMFKKSNVEYRMLEISGR